MVHPSCQQNRCGGAAYPRIRPRLQLLMSGNSLCNSYIRASSSNMTNITASASSYSTSLQRDGFVVVPSLISQSEINALRNATTKATKLTRSGQWPFFRTVPKQFPPWPKELPPSSEGGIWGVQHLLHPEMSDRDAFAKFYFSEKVLNIVEDLVGVNSSGATDNTTSSSSSSTTGTRRQEDANEEEPLVMELFNLLVAPEVKEFELRWHRDDIPATVSPEEELRLLESKSPHGRQSHAQYNLALCSDSSLIVVPGSHRRVRTEVERNADPHEPVLPGQVTVSLEPGDAVFYDSNILHRGVYKPKSDGGEETRLTLHGSVGVREIVSTSSRSSTSSMTKESSATKKARIRATAVLQHGVGQWIDREDANLSHISDRAERMRRNLIAMGRGDDVGYSLDG